MYKSSRRACASALMHALGKTVEDVFLRNSRQGAQSSISGISSEAEGIAPALHELQAKDLMSKVLQQEAT